jgi:RNA polymerase sigma-70 factor (ECF subfamily)
MGVTMQIREDVRGDLAQDLLVGTTDRPPRLLEYAGRGDLWSWVRVSAVRAALKRRDRAGREIALTHSVLDALARQPGPGTPLPSDPELRAVRQQFRPRFEAAFTEALAALPARERNVLLQHHLDGLTTDQLGALYRVHRVTISRWLIGARGRLLQQTRERLIGAFALTPSECDSVIRLVRSQIDLTLASLAGT